MVKVSLLSFFGFAIALGIYASRVSAADDVSRLGHFTCTVDVSFATNDASSSFAFGKVLRRPASDTHQANLIGRGVSSCRNDQGFQFNLPSLIAIALTSSTEIPIHNLRATVQPISVDRDVNRIFDRYEPHAVLSDVATTTPNSAAEEAIVVQGQKNNLLVQVDLNLPPDFKSKVRISEVDLKFDPEAPKIKTE